MDTSLESRIAQSSVPENPIRQDLIGTTPIVEWILPHFLPQGAFIALAGAPGSGKSFLCYTIGLAVAAGVPVLGIAPKKPCKVLYFDQENSEPDRIQYERWAWHGLGNPSLDLICQNFWRVPFALGSPDWAVIARRSVEEHRPELIIIDTTTPALAIEDENDNAEAARAIGKVRALQNLMTPAATVLALKHSKVKSEDGGLTLRGAKAWEGQVDGILYIKNGEGRPRTDGLTPKVISSGKTRAFGLRTDLKIRPEWTPDRSGIILYGG